MEDKKDLDEEIKKAKQLVNLLREAKEIVDSLYSDNETQKCVVHIGKTELKPICDEKQSEGNCIVDKTHYKEIREFDLDKELEVWEMISNLKTGNWIYENHYYKNTNEKPLVLVLARIS